MERAVSSLPLSSSWLAKLASCGFEQASDLKSVGVVELSREIGVSNSEALEIIRVAKGVNGDSTNSRLTTRAAHSPDVTGPPHVTTGSGRRPDSPASHSALELLQREQGEASIVTFSAGIDELLGGGVAPGKVTEFCGGPGMGKTQISIQLAVDASIPAPLGGVGGEAVYIDTEGSFVPERVAEVARAAVRHLGSVEDTDSVVREAVAGFSLETVLSSIHLYRCHDYLELLATINILPDFIQLHPKVRLVVIDSIAAHFRHGFSDMSRRNRLLGIASQALIQLATLHRVAIVLTNQMTTKVVRGERKSARLVPALGESWGHASTVRVVLSCSDSERRATLYKSPTHREATASFAITADGIRDSPLPEEIPSTPITSSQCVALEEDFSGTEENETDELTGDSAVWPPGGAEAEGRTEPGSDFARVSSFHGAAEQTEQERKGRKRPHPSDPEQ